MKPMKLLVVPAVVIFSVLVAVPAYAWTVNNVSFTLGCQRSDGRIGVTMDGRSDLSSGERFLFFDLSARGSTRVLDTTAMRIQKDTTSATGHFKSVADQAGALDVTLVRVTSDAAGQRPADLKLQFASGQTWTYTARMQPAHLVGTIEGCTQPSPSPSPSHSHSPSPSPSASAASPSTPVPSPSVTPLATLAQTGGFDLRLVIIGFAATVLGLALFLIGGSRARRSTGVR